MENDRIILGLMSCDMKVDIKKLKELCKDQVDLLTEGFPGYKVRFPSSIHELYYHLPKEIEKNNGYGLKKYSEENLEHCHKNFRHIREKLARKTSRKDNYRDSLRRVALGSDPVLTNFISDSLYTCSICHQKGHTKKSCLLLRTDDNDGDRISGYIISDNLEPMEGEFENIQMDEIAQQIDEDIIDQLIFDQDPDEQLRLFEIDADYNNDNTSTFYDDIDFDSNESEYEDTYK